jgi:hypothetical protein
MWLRRFKRLKWLGIASASGLPFFVVAAVRGHGVLSIAFVLAGSVLFFPGFIYLYILTIWHWKDRYDGEHSDLWGALLLIETSGWFKIVYLFRHLLPDALEMIHASENAPLSIKSPPPPDTQ